MPACGAHRPGAGGAAVTPENLIRLLGPVAVDVFAGDHTQSASFQTRRRPLPYAGGRSEPILLRRTTLEDVFLTQVGRGLEAV